MKTTRLFIPLVLGAMASLALLWALGGAASSVTAAPVLSGPQGAVEGPAKRPMFDATLIHYVAVTGTDSGDCSTPTAACRTVQYAVDRAGEGDEVRVASGTYTDVQSRPSPPGYNGPLVITQVLYISKAVTVQGGYTTIDWNTSDPEANPSTLDAQWQGRVLYITGEVSPTIEGLRITGGDATGLGGTPWGDDAGGGVYLITATASIDNNWVFSNTGFHGGGVCLYQCTATFNGNTIVSNTGVAGGGLSLVSSTVTLSSNIVMSNSGGQGGGLSLLWSNATLNNNDIISNTANAGGGGLMLSGSEATLNGDTVASNTCEHAGGGGLYLLDDSSVTLRNATITSNTTDTGGGGLDLLWSHAVLIDTAITANTADARGGLSLTGSDATLVNAVITNNRTNSGGIELGLWGSDVTLVNSVLADNQPNSGGSLLDIQDSSCHLLHTTVMRSNGSSGDGIRLSGYSTAVLTNTILVGHTVGITVAQGNTATLEATLWGNTTDWAGAGSITTGTVNLWGAPAFVDPDVGDYHIGPGSAAIDAGVDAGVNDDMDGDPRPMGLGYDIGADEAWWWCRYLPLVMRTYP